MFCLYGLYCNYLVNETTKYLDNNWLTKLSRYPIAIIEEALRKSVDNNQN